MALQYEFPSSTNCKLARDDLERFRYTLVEKDFDTLVVIADDSEEQAIDDIIHRYGALKVDHSDDEEDPDNVEVESLAVGRAANASEVDEAEREQERDANVSTPR